MKDYTSPSNEDKIFSAGIPIPDPGSLKLIQGTMNGAIVESWLKRGLITKDMLCDKQKQFFTFLDKYQP